MLLRPLLLEGRDDRARSNGAGTAIPRKARKRVARPLHLCNFRVQRGDALAGEFAGTGTVVGRIQRYKLGDLLERKPGRLR